ncbi:hypothetical protein D030_5436B, partial [Vibrio parahaemolyticus AQ3810]
APCSFS